ncbi:YfbU family protein [Acinetobacter pittii]|uniref:YfbU family protein n=5 Tax=Moraxellaceae TaxID=468 RepID=UPI0025B1A471|nr:YfbU family protein [Acinetobacter pittii]
MKIELTDKERLFLANQHEILGHLNKDNSDYHFKLAEQLRDGHEWLYSQSFDNFSENLPDDAAELVLNILQIYEMIQDAYDGLSDKSLISEHQIKFPGFDGNNETEFMGFVDALEKDNRFVDVIQTGNRNSHSPKVHVYERMIAK